MLIINLAGVALIALVIWWFWLHKPKEIAVAEGEVTIIVENGTYQPSHIKLAANKPVRLHFLRKDATPCSESVLIPALEITETLPINKKQSVDLPPLDKGEYEFHCQMQMYRGTLKVS